MWLGVESQDYSSLLVATVSADDNGLPIVVPALVSVGVALLSTLVTIVTLTLKNRDESARRAHETRLAVLARRVDSLEAAWVETFTMEQTGRASTQLADLVRGSVWMSPHLQSAYVKLLASSNPSSTDFTEVRRLLRADLEGLTK
jgi:hypothetical protein